MMVMVSYDISDDKRRSAVSRILKNFGVRVQRSVFDCDITPSLLSVVRALISDNIDVQNDSIRFYVFCSACRNKIEVCGAGKLPEEDDGFYLV